MKAVERIDYIDYAKFLGLFLMIVGHKNLLSASSSAVIFAFHMPLFFIISGMFHKPKPFAVMLTKVYKTLLLPFLIIALSWCIIYLFFLIRKNMVDVDYIFHVLGTFLSIGESTSIFSSYCIYIWFLLALAEIKLMTTLFSGKRKLVLLAICSIILFVFFENFEITRIYLGVLSIDSALLALPFYVIGFLIKDYVLTPTDSFRISKKSFVIVLSCMLLTLFLSRTNGIVDIHHCKYGDNLLLFYVTGVLGSLFIIELARIKCQYIPNGKITQTIVSGATIIIGYSAWTTGLIKPIFLVLCNNNLGGFIIAVIVLAVLYPIILIASKYFPPILGKRNIR